MKRGASRATPALNGVRRCRLFLVLFLVAVSALLSTWRNSEAIGFDISLDPVNLARLIMDVWQKSSEDAKKAVPVEELIREMSSLVGQREAFLPKFADFMRNPTKATSLELDRLRRDARGMLNTARNIERMVRWLDPKFVAGHTNVHTTVTSVAKTRAATIGDTTQVLLGNQRIDRKTSWRDWPPGPATCAG